MPGHCPPPKVLHVCALGLTAQQLLRTQVDHLRARGFEVDIACSPGPETDELGALGYTMRAVEIERRIASPRNVLAVRRLVQLIAEQRYDIVHVHTPIAAALGRVAARLARVPHIVYTAHGFPFHDRSSPLERTLYSTVERACGYLTTHTLVQNREDLDLARRFSICPPDRISYLGNGVDLERFDRRRLPGDTRARLRAELGIPANHGPVVAMIGRLTYKKGLGDLVDAIARVRHRFPDVHLLVIGAQLASDPEPFETEVRRRIANLGLDRHVTFAGQRSDVPELLSVADVFSLPTFSHEGLPRSIVEAMAMSLPVVSTDIRGCREAVAHGETGYIVPPRDSPALARALEQLLGDPTLRHRLGTAGRQRAETLYDERLVFERLVALYDRLLNRGDRSGSTAPPLRADRRRVG